MKSLYIAYDGFIFEEKDFEDVTGCIVCGSQNLQSVSCIEKILNIHHLRCGFCDAVMSSKILTDKALDSFYTRYDNSYQDRNKLDRKGLAAHFVKHIVISKKSISILDFGGHDGRNAYHIAQQLLLELPDIKEINILVADYDAELIKSDSCKIIIHKVTLSKFFENSSQFDIILCRAILEHVKNSGKILYELLNRLKSGGYLYSITAYIQPLYSALLKFGIKINILYPEHIGDYSKEFHDNILRTLNLESSHRVVISQPSFYENKLFSKFFFQALAARIIRFPYFFWKNYPFVGGWELICQKQPSNEPEV